MSGNHSFGSITTGANSSFNATTGTNTITGGLIESDFAGTLGLNGGAWAIGGTGGLFEGDFLQNEREVRINQDPALNFDGVDDIITIADSASLDLSSGDVLTLSAWTYWDASSFNTDRKILAKGHVAAGTNDYSAYQLRSHDSTGRLYLSIYNGSWDEAYTDPGFLSETNTWVHIAVTLASDNVVNFYKNGVLHTAHTISHAIPANSGPLLIGARGDSTGDNAKDYFDGKIADVRIYDSALAVADIQKLASKMFIGVGSPVGWWKLNDGTTSVVDSSINTNTGTISGATWTYNDFGVDIQDATTTVSNLIVESGQLNTKALASVHLDGAADYITCGTASSLRPTDTMTFSMWINADTLTDYDTLFCNEKSQGTESSKGYRFWVLNDGSVTFRLNETSSATVGAGTITTGNWYHIVGTYNKDAGGSDEQKLYVNGVQVATADYSATIAHQTANPTLIGQRANTGTAIAFDGKMRDVRLYDYALSADQVSSLYRGSYNVTPLHGWKLDEGTAANAAGDFEDFGTGTDADGEGVSISAFGDGTLKVNGAARVLTNGSVS